MGPGVGPGDGPGVGPGVGPGDGLYGHASRCHWTIAAPACHLKIVKVHQWGTGAIRTDISGTLIGGQSSTSWSQFQFF